MEQLSRVFNEVTTETEMYAVAYGALGEVVRHHIMRSTTEKELERQFEFIMGCMVRTCKRLNPEAPVVTRPLREGQELPAP